MCVCVCVRESVCVSVSVFYVCVCVCVCVFYKSLFLCHAFCPSFFSSMLMGLWLPR